MKKSGELYKKGEFSTNKRYFTIKRDALYYFESIKETTGPALGQFDLVKLKSVTKGDKTKQIDGGQKYEIRIKFHDKAKEITLFSDTSQDCDHWVQVLSSYAKEELEIEVIEEKEPIQGKEKKKFALFSSKSEDF